MFCRRLCKSCQGVSVLIPEPSARSRGLILRRSYDSCSAKDRQLLSEFRVLDRVCAVAQVAAQDHVVSLKDLHQAVASEQNELAHHLERGRPLIVALRPTGSTSLHYAVVAGLDDAESVLLVNDPARRKLLKLDRGEFEKGWKDTQDWTLLALPRAAR